MGIPRAEIFDMLWTVPGNRIVRGETLGKGTPGLPQRSAGPMVYQVGIQRGADGPPATTALLLDGEDLPAMPWMVSGKRPLRRPWVGRFFFFK